MLNTKTAGSETRYLHKDHLGSTDVITDELGSVVERQSFDAHGLRRYTDWQAAPIGFSITSLFTTRGFTGHEMDDEIGLINMNARMYDPVLGRFLSPDTYVQFPDNAQSYNRYTYVNNNPLSYTDPSGHFLKGLFKSVKKLFKSVKSFIRPILAIASLAFIPNPYLAGFIAGGVTGGNLKSAIGGAITAGLFNLAHGLEGIEAVLAHGGIGGLSAELQGGDFGAGFLSGGFSKLASLSKVFDQLGDPTKWAGRLKNAVAAAVVGGVASVLGGVASVLGGGKFRNGAITGAFSRLFNDLGNPSPPELSPSELEGLSRSIRENSTELLHSLNRNDSMALMKLGLNPDHVDIELHVSAASIDLSNISQIAIGQEVHAALYDKAIILPADFLGSLASEKGVIWKAVAQTFIQRLIPNPLSNKLSHTIRCTPRCDVYIRINNDSYKFYHK